MNARVGQKKKKLRKLRVRKVFKDETSERNHDRTPCRAGVKRKKGRLECRKKKNTRNGARNAPKKKTKKIMRDMLPSIKKKKQIMNQISYSSVRHTDH